MDFGRKWQLVHDDVMPGRFYWYDYVALILELLFCAVIDCNLHTESDISKGSSGILSKTDLSHCSCAES